MPEGINSSSSSCALIRILIAEDSNDIRIAAKRMLEKAGHAVDLVNNGRDAVAAFSRSSYDLVLMDMEMPVMDGYTAARAINCLAGNKKVSIIAMTSHEGESEVRQCLRAGCTGYIHKPLSEKTLMEALAVYTGQALSSSGTSSRPFSGQAGDRHPGQDHTVYIDPELAALVPGFLANRKKDSGEIARLLEEGDMNAVRIIGHSMAGSAGGYGFPEIGKKGKAIEAAALKGKKDMIEKLNKQLAEYLDTISVDTAQ
jgi:CheY-like chemotaxis protein/HPt (histidine-containing phosphotransfer) domain-containing protein